MIEDIKEQPNIIRNILNDCLPLNKEVKEFCLNIKDINVLNISRIHIIASGSSRNTGNIAKYFLEELARIPSETEYASEFAHKNPVLSNNDLVIAISQSGETGDTLAALKVAADKGAYTLAITNNPESRIHKLSKAKIQAKAGKERSIAATKSVMAQLINLYALAIYLAEKRNTYDKDNLELIKKELHSVPEKLEKMIENACAFDKAAEIIKNSKSLVLLGRGLNHACAQEGAIKIKETSYIDANGYPSGEFLHGYIAVVDEKIPVVSIMAGDKEKCSNYKLASGNTEVIRDKRNPHFIIIKNEDNKEPEEKFKNADFINIPESSEIVSPIYVLVCLQLLSLKIAEKLGRDTLTPRSLEKAITSE